MARQELTLTQLNLTRELANALGVGSARKAVLTIEAGTIPRLDVTYHALEGRGGEVPPDLASRIARVPFKLRLHLQPMEN